MDGGHTPSKPQPLIREMNAEEREPMRRTINRQKLKATLGASGEKLEKAWEIRSVGHVWDK
jgi:hypothetical protein